MTELIGNNQVKKNDGSVVTAQEGGWYDGRRVVGGQLLAPGEHQSGQLVSSEVNRQSDVAQGLQPGSIDKFLETQRKQPQQSAQPSAPRVASNTSGARTSSGASTGSGAGFQAPQPIDLVGNYKDILAGTGIKDKEAQLSQMEKDFITAKGDVNDNPFLSEGSRVGREAKLNTLFNERTANIRGEIATARADAETQMNLKLKQFDMNSEQTKQAMDQFNFLLSSGALNNASGEDIANITMATGLSSTLIQGAIQESQKADVKSQVITSTDNNGNVTVTTVNTNTGEIISQNSLGSVGASKTTGGTSTVKPGSSQFISENKSAVSTFLFNNQNDYGHVSPGVWNQALQAWLIDGLGSRDDFINNFKNLTSPNRGDFETQSGYGFPLYVREE